MHSLKFEQVTRQVCATIFFAVLLPAVSFGQNLRIEIMDTYTGYHFTLDPNSPFDVQGSATFSPDQKWVAFDAHRKGERFHKKRLLITKANGSQREPTDLVCGAMPSFSKDGKLIAYSSADRAGVWVMDIDGENKKRVAEGWAIQFSPQDNDVVAYKVNNPAGQNIQIHNLETDDTRLLLPEEIAASYQGIGSNFQWSPDGSKIVLRGRIRDGFKGFSVIAAMGTGEDPQHEIVTIENAADLVVFHPVKNQVFYSKRMPSKGTHRIFSIDLDVPEKFRVPVYLASQPDQRWNTMNHFSRDGNLIAFASKPIPTESAMDSMSFAKKVRPTLPVIAKLKRARLNLLQGDYESFVNVLMGELDEVYKNTVVEDAEEKANQWLATLNESLARADQAITEDDSIVFPVGRLPGGLKMMEQDGEWVLDASLRPNQPAPAGPDVRLPAIRIQNPVGGRRIIPMGPVVVATGPLDLRTELTEKNVKIENWPTGIINPEAVTSLEDIVDMVTSTRLTQGMPILKGSIQHKNATRIPPNMKVVAIRIPADDVVGSLLEPDDRVDVIGIFKQRDRNTNRITTVWRTFLKAVKVYSIGNRTRIDGNAKSRTSPASSIVGLLVTEKQSEALVFVMDNGSIKLVMRGDDAEDDGEVGPLQEMKEIVSEDEVTVFEEIKKLRALVDKQQQVLQQFQKRLEHLEQVKPSK